jgi:hypothetical protein
VGVFEIRSGKKMKIDEAAGAHVAAPVFNGAVPDRSSPLLRSNPFTYVSVCSWRRELNLVLPTSVVGQVKDVEMDVHTAAKIYK